MTEAESRMRIARTITAMAELYYFDSDPTTFSNWTQIDVDAIEPDDMVEPHGPLARAICSVLNLMTTSTLELDTGPWSGIDVAEVQDEPTEAATKTCEFCMNNAAEIHLTEGEVDLCRECFKLHGDMFEEDAHAVDDTVPLLGAGETSDDLEPDDDTGPDPEPSGDDGIVETRVRSWGVLSKEKAGSSNPALRIDTELEGAAC